MRETISITAISDLHGYTPRLPAGDILIVAGDLTARDDPVGYLEVLDWAIEQPFERVILIAGNHDMHLQKDNYKRMVVIEKMAYLEDQLLDLGGLKIYGSPWTLTFPGINPICSAFTVDTEEQMAEKYAAVPDNLDILITHGPPYCILDQVNDFKNGTIRNTGSRALLDLIKQKKPRYHIFGHIHQNGGMVYNVPGQKTTCMNVCLMNEQYKPRWPGHLTFEIPPPSPS